MKLISIQVTIVPTRSLSEGQSFFFDTEWEADSFISKMIRVGIDSARFKVVRHFDNKSEDLH